MNDIKISSDLRREVAMSYIRSLSRKALKQINETGVEKAEQDIRRALKEIIEETSYVLKSEEEESLQEVTL